MADEKRVDFNQLRQRPAVKALIIKEIGGQTHFFYQEKNKPRKFRSAEHIKADLPGGTVEGSESREQAALREVYEETKLKVQHLRQINEWVSPRPEKGDVLVGTTHLCRYVSGEPMLSSELEKGYWRKVSDRKELAQWIIDDLKAAGY